MSTEKTVINFSINIDEVNIIMAALQELPYRIADPILRKMVEQAQEQLNK